MELSKEKKNFIELWGNFGSQWGINKTMAQIHALLLVSEEAICTDDAMKTLSISRGGAHSGLKELISWNLIYKVSKLGDRREFFEAEKNAWTIARRIVIERKRREIEPLKFHLEKLQNESSDEVFKEMISDFDRIINRLDSIASLALKIDENKLFNILSKAIKLK